MTPRAARIAARKCLRDALAQGLCAEVLAVQFARRCLNEMGCDDATATSAVSQVWREDFGVMQP